ncbi:hypothetical protein HBH47_082580 [Parastagonospora nodorum]|nr:hypothetical protein HBH47_082580 [Parastagonospora nodorum]KAH5255885.1 hypothetical protein HBI72_129840 [Parastagonospora nodorum]KAH6257032.1 hypothetical protein HBI41_161340 [Parastagonospora nodorum]
MPIPCGRCGSDSLAEPRVQDSAYSSDDPDGDEKYPTHPPRKQIWTRPLQTLDPNEGRFEFSDDEDDEEPSTEARMDSQVSINPSLFDVVKRHAEAEKLVRECGAVPCSQQVIYDEGKHSATVPATKKNKKRKEKPITTLRRDWEEEMCGWFAVTRLHNGPGLMDRKPPSVKLPIRMEDRSGERERKRKRKVKMGRPGSSDSRAGSEMRTQIPLGFDGGSKVKVRLPRAQHLRGCVRYENLA